MPDPNKNKREFFRKAFHVGRPNLAVKEKVMQRLAQVLDNQWLTNMGPVSLELEERIAGMLEVKHCICVCNATIGLELLQRALDLKGEVIIPSFTFIATAHSLRWQRIEPVFCDIRIDDHLIDSSKIEALITKRTSAILAVPIWGQPCDYESLNNIADRNGLKLIFDSAHAFGCKYKDRFIGSFGDAEVFSFHATKVFSTGEGGAITTNCDELAHKLRLMRNFGFTAYDKTSLIGTNAKMSEFSAAYGLAHLDELDSIISHNKFIHDAYLEEFSQFNEISFLNYSFEGCSNYQYVVARVPSDFRNLLVEYFHERDVLLRKYFYPGCHRMEPYCSSKNYTSLELPNTDKISSEIIIFPTGNQVSYEDIKNFAKLFKDFLRKNRLLK